MLHPPSMMLCLAAFVQTAHAASPPCTVEYATDLVQIDDIQRRGRAAKATMPLLNELNVINSRAKDPHRPIGDQLASRDAARFAELAQQNKLIRLSAFVESAQARDAGVVQRMEAAAWKSYTEPAYSPPANDIPAMILGVMRIMLPASEKWEAPATPSCSVDVALASQQQAGFARINRMMPTVDRVTPLLKGLIARYGGGKGGTVDLASMSPEDARAFQSLQVEIQPALREQTLALDLQHVRAWWATAGIVYLARKEDIATYADIEHIENTLKAKLKDMTTEQQALVGLWRKVDERILSLEQAQMEQLTKPP